MCGGKTHPHGKWCHGEEKHICLREVPVRGLLHLSILNLIKNGSIYGAEIYRALREKYNVEAPKALIYGLLRRMEHAGFLVSSWDVEGGGPARRKYKITEEGLDYLRDSLENLRRVKNLVNLLLAEDRDRQTQEE
ncbi:MAG: PadR family transcriptional regulator [Candidatus Brockarchaeota archaeon]|nr:PadR family transcriptional regulator [Candidatus Brockarchaeota archaeon]